MPTSPYSHSEQQCPRAHLVSPFLIPLNNWPDRESKSSLARELVESFVCGRFEIFETMGFVYKYDGPVQRFQFTYAIPRCFNSHQDFTSISVGIQGCVP